jgi:hypothetical protein
MKNLRCRIEQLEQRTGASQQRLVLVVTRSEVELPLDTDRCEEILTESGYMRNGSMAILDLTNVPHGLSAKELEQYLREHGEEICNRGSRSAVS